MEGRCVHKGVQLRHDRQCDRFGCAAADWQTDRCMQPVAQPRALGAEVTKQLVATRGWAEQSDVGDGSRRQRRRYARSDGR